MITQNKDDDRIKKLEMFAWVGEDEFGSGEIGIKQGKCPAGDNVPLASIHRHKVEQFQEQLRAQASIFGKTIRLVRFVYEEELMALEPTKL